MTRRFGRPGRHFRLSRYRSAVERREHALAAALVASLQGAIAVSLAVCAAQTYRMWRSGLAYLPGELGRALPAGLALGAAVALAATLRSIRRVRSIRRTAVDPPAGPGDGLPPA